MDNLNLAFIRPLFFIVFSWFFSVSSVYADSYPVPYRSCDEEFAIQYSPGAYGTTSTQLIQSSPYPICKMLRSDGSTAGYLYPGRQTSCVAGTYDEASLSCINVPACPGGAARDSLTHICGPEPCQSGITKNLSVSRPSGQAVFYSGVGPTVADGGCGFTCTAAGADNSINPSTGVTTSTYSCVSNGNDAPGNALVSTSAPPETNLHAPSGCVVGKGSDGKMITSCVKPDGCGTVEGIEVCMDGINIKDKSGNVVNAGPGKNCVGGGGKVVCQSDLDNATSSVSMVQPDGTTKTTYLDSKVKTDKTETTTANPDGSVTNTVNETNNIVGDTVRTTTTTTAANGDKTTSEVGGRLDDNHLLEQIAGKTTDCEKNPSSIGCSGYGDTSDTGGASFDVGNSINPMASFSPTSIGVASSCPAPASFVTHGKLIAFSYQSYCDFAGMIKPLILISASIGALYIVSSSVRDS